MGLDYNGVRFLLLAKATGVDFSRTATLGRQYLHASNAELSRNLADFGMSLPDAAVAALLSAQHGYAEPLLKLMGATEAVSIDASRYEGAAVLHDMNEPVAEVMKNAFSVVVDGGTLEHVFNFPVAIRNCMEMVRPGGHFLGIAPANNFMGHGFYQFSPELYFRVFSEVNGFALERLLLFEESSRDKWYEVVDPQRIHARVELVNKRPTYLLIQAKKIRQVEEILGATPQQSDYVAAWDDKTPAAAANAAVPGMAWRLDTVLKSLMPRALRDLLRRSQASRCGLSNTAFFRKVDAVELAKISAGR